MKEEGDLQGKNNIKMTGEFSSNNYCGSQYYCINSYSDTPTDLH